MVQIPYLQPFDDVNKRVSRLATNIPLIKRNLTPLSFTDIRLFTYTGAEVRGSVIAISIQKFGAFVELAEVFVEGLLPIAAFEEAAGARCTYREFDHSIVAMSAGTSSYRDPYSRSEKSRGTYSSGRGDQSATGPSRDATWRIRSGGDNANESGWLATSSARAITGRHAGAGPGKNAMSILISPPRMNLSILPAQHGRH